MRGIIQENYTPQNKMVAVNNKFGNTNIKSQQGTTRVIFDSIPLDGRTNFRFFENANTRTFPLTTIGAEANPLEVLSTFTNEKIYFNLVTYDSTNNTITATNGGILTAVGGFNGGIGAGELDFTIANNQVIKQLPIAWALSSNLNPSATNTQDVALGLLTDIVIPPLLEYIATLKTTSYDVTGLTFTHIQLYMQGTAGIIAPQTTF